MSNVNHQHITRVWCFTCPGAPASQGCWRPGCSSTKGRWRSQRSATSKATFEIGKRFMEGIVFTNTPWPIISDEKYVMVDIAWKRTIGAHDRQWALAGAPVGTPSVCQLPGGPSLTINLQTREAVSVYSVFCSSIGLMMILIPNLYLVRTKDWYHSRAFGWWRWSNYCPYVPVEIWIGDWASNPG